MYSLNASWSGIRIAEGTAMIGGSLDSSSVVTETCILSCCGAKACFLRGSNDSPSESRFLFSPAISGGRVMSDCVRIVPAQVWEFHKKNEIEEKIVIFSRGLGMIPPASEIYECLKPQII
jgi:hypothetical protein